MATLKEPENGLGSTDFYLISKLGATRLIPTALTHVPHYYCGMELHSLPLKMTAVQINCLGTSTSLTTTRTEAIDHMQVEIGVIGCPLLYDYNKYRCLATNRWTKTLWENITAYDIEVRLKYPTMKQPNGSQDKRIMEMLVEGFGMCNKNLMHFNRPCNHQQATFLSYTATAKGGEIGKLLMSNWQETHEGFLGEIDQRQRMARSIQQRKTGHCRGEHGAVHTRLFRNRKP